MWEHFSVMRKFFFLVTPILLTACAGSVDYRRPEVSSGSDAMVVNRPKAALMRDLPQLMGKRFFVGRGAAQGDSFLATYSGNPEPYINCGRIASKVSGPQGERTFEFAGARAQQNYEVMFQGAPTKVDRRMNLDATVTYTLTEISADKTRVAVVSRYAVTRTSFVYAAGAPTTATDSIAFSTGEGKAFDNRSGQNTECRGTGKLEAEALSLLR